MLAPPVTSTSACALQGKVSIMAHSLGSVLSYDVLCNQAAAAGAPGPESCLLTPPSPTTEIEECVGRWTRHRVHWVVCRLAEIFHRLSPSHDNGWGHSSSSPLPTTTGCARRWRACTPCSPSSTSRAQTAPARRWRSRPSYSTSTALSSWVGEGVSRCSVWWGERLAPLQRSLHSASLPHDRTSHDTRVSPYPPHTQAPRSPSSWPCVA